jgi:hypothetical protein
MQEDEQLALILGATGPVRHADRWWSTAQRSAERSGDPEVVALVRGKALVRWLYERPVAPLLDQAAPLTAGPCAGRLSWLAGRAQGYAMLGRSTEAHGALRELTETYAQFDDTDAGDGAVLGCTEVNIHHTTSYVHTYLGEVKPAFAAQDRALALYPPGDTVQSAMVQLHRARCLVIDGDIGDGLAIGAAALDRVPAIRRGGPVGTLALAVRDAVPAAERTRVGVDELDQRLTM